MCKLNANPIQRVMMLNEAVELESNMKYQTRLLIPNAE